MVYDVDAKYLPSGNTVFVVYDENKPLRFTNSYRDALDWCDRMEDLGYVKGSLFVEQVQEINSDKE